MSNTFSIPPSEARRKVSDAVMATQFKNWCFTAYQDSKGASFTGTSDVSNLTFRSSVAEARWQLEKCPTSGRIHVQGVLRVVSRAVLSTVKLALESVFKGAHIEACKGTWEQNVSYVSKPETHVAGPWRWPDRAKTPFVRTVEFWFGQPGNGKSTEARTLLASKGYEVYEVAKSEASKGTWLSGYNGEEGVIMDEVSSSWFDEGNWKKVLDRLPQKLPAGAGGNNVMWTPKHIIMISNYMPDTLFRTDPFRTRIANIRYIDRPAYPIKQTELNYNELDPLLVQKFRRPLKRKRDD